MSEHTSPPWRVTDSQNEGSNSVRIFAGAEYLATVGGSDHSRATFESNARLIAAAPEAIAACEMFIGWADYLGVPPALDEAVEAARAAVAKAKGAEQ